MVCYGRLSVPSPLQPSTSSSSSYRPCHPIFSPYFACNSRCKRYFSATGIASTSVPVSRDVTPEIVTAQIHPGETYVRRSVVSPQGVSRDGRNILDWRVRCKSSRMWLVKTRAWKLVASFIYFQHLNDKSDSYIRVFDHSDTRDFLLFLFLLILAILWA